MIVSPVTFEAAYFVAANMRAADAREVFATRWTDCRDTFAASVAARGPYAWCVGHDEPVCCIGVINLWPGVWEAWMFATDRFPTVGFALTRWIRRTMMPVVMAAGAHRVQAHSMEGHAVAHRWLEDLGAVHEHTVPALGKGGEAFRVYAWVGGDALPQ